MNRRTFICCVGCTGAAGLVARAGAAETGLDGAARPAETKTPRPEDLGYCGADCAACDVRKATVEGDEEARARAVVMWEKTAQRHWGMKTLDPAILGCAGCRVTEKKHKGYGRCPMLPCARKRGLTSCALCPTWRDCDYLKGVFANEPRARERLQAIAAAHTPGPETRP